MSPPKPENDPVQKGLHQLGQQIDNGGGQPDAGADPAEDPVEKGLHDLGRQIHEANRTGWRRKRTIREEDAARLGPAHAAPKGRRSRKRTAAWIGGTLALVLVLIVV